MKEDRLGNKTRLQHIVLALDEIRGYTKEVSFEDFSKNSMMLNATLRQMEIIGEASNRLSADMLESNPQVEWAKIVGLRNLIIHEYFAVDADIVWKIIHNNLPVFEAQIQAILKNYVE
jgi:uncharacterized protein with HEPN domain